MAMQPTDPFRMIVRDPFRLGGERGTVVAGVVASGDLPLVRISVVPGSDTADAMARCRRRPAA